ncbi:M48 family peptidase [Candidatus Parcubacteria bacterium]|nr:MAG: M48 family peptidase [Candidatus Parcubacteria bacterium]
MQKQITLQNKTVAYTLRKSRRAKRMRLAVYCNGAVVITTPYGLQETIAERFIREKTDWLFSKIAFFKQFQGKLASRHSKEDYLKYKDKALALAQERVEFFNQQYSFFYNVIRIKDQKTRWGSCSKKNNLNFNYKILFLLAPLRDYIIVHELCHLKEFNHSMKFWKLVAKMIPNYLEIRKNFKSGDTVLSIL